MDYTDNVNVLEIMGGSVCIVMNRIGDIQSLMHEDRSKDCANESDVTNKIVDGNEELLQLLKQQNKLINQIWESNENEKYRLAQQTLDPLEQILYSALLGIRTINEETQSESAKEYLATLKMGIEQQLQQLKIASISLYPICMQDLGPYDAIKSYYELLKEGNQLTINIHFKGSLKRQPQKVEIKLYRLIQYLIGIIDNAKTVSSLHVFAEQNDQQIVVTFDGESLVEKFNDSSEYQVLKELIDSIADVHIREKDDCQIHLVLNLQ